MTLAALALARRPEINGQLIMNGGTPLLRLPLSDAIDVTYFAFVRNLSAEERAGFDQRLTGAQAVTPEMSALGAIREAMGAPPVRGAGATPKVQTTLAEPDVKQELSVIEEMRRAMGLSPNPPSGKSGGPTT